jgi:hypothetical protein
MPALNFQKQFAALVESGEKRQTIRAERKDGRMPAKPGDIIALYTGMRTKSCRKLADVECIAVETIRISYGYITVNYQAQDEYQLAVADGFEDVAAMRDWFSKTHGLPFTGHLIRWKQPSVSGTEEKDDAGI